MSFLNEGNIARRIRNYLIYSPSSGPATQTFNLWTNYFNTTSGQEKFALYVLDPSAPTPGLIQQALVFDSAVVPTDPANFYKPPIGANGTLFFRGAKSAAPNFGRILGSYIKSGLDMTRIDGAAAESSGTVSTNGDMVGSSFVQAHFDSGLGQSFFRAFNLVGNVLTLTGSTPIADPFAGAYGIPGSSDLFAAIITQTDQRIFQIIAGVPTDTGGWPAPLIMPLAATFYFGGWNNAGNVFAVNGAGNLITNSFFTLDFNGSAMTSLNVQPYISANVARVISFSPDDTKVVFQAESGFGQLLRVFNVTGSAFNFEYTNLSGDTGARAAGFATIAGADILYTLQNRLLRMFSFDDAAQTMTEVFSGNLDGTVLNDFMTSGRFYYTS